jgi:hypothetical protein
MLSLFVPHWVLVNQVKMTHPSQSAVHIVVGPCAKGYFIHTGSLDLQFFFFFSHPSLPFPLPLL